MDSLKEHQSPLATPKATSKISDVRAFIDTSALLALSHARDRHHLAARALADGHSASGGRFVGSTLVLAEFHAHLMYLRGPLAAASALGHLLEDPQHEWCEVSDELLREARARWILRFADQDFSLTDAVSFEIMHRERLTQAFAFDHHFEIAGFQRLH